MIIDGQTNNIINLTLQVLLISTWIAIPITMMLALMYLYKKFKKWETKEIKEAERIIVKRNIEINKTSETINLLADKEQELKKEVERLEALRISIASEVGEVVETEDSVQQKINYNELNIKELQAIAKEKGVSGFSRMKKTKLIDILNRSSL
jgi:sugar phosphate isomerase/epimerase